MSSIKQVQDAIYDILNNTDFNQMMIFSLRTIEMFHNVKYSTKSLSSVEALANLVEFNKFTEIYNIIQNFPDAVEIYINILSSCVLDLELINDTKNVDELLSLVVKVIFNNTNNNNICSLLSSLIKIFDSELDYNLIDGCIDKFITTFLKSTGSFLIKNEKNIIEQKNIIGIFSCVLEKGLKHTRIKAIDVEFLPIYSNVLIQISDEDIVLKVLSLLITIEKYLTNIHEDILKYFLVSLDTVYQKTLSAEIFKLVCKIVDSYVDKVKLKDAVIAIETKQVWSVDDVRNMITHIHTLQYISTNSILFDINVEVFLRCWFDIDNLTQYDIIVILKVFKNKLNYISRLELVNNTFNLLIAIENLCQTVEITDSVLLNIIFNLYINLITIYKNRNLVVENFDSLVNNVITTIEKYREYSPNVHILTFLLTIIDLLNIFISYDLEEHVYEALKNCITSDIIIIINKIVESNIDIGSEEQRIKILCNYYNIVEHLISIKPIFYDTLWKFIFVDYGFDTYLAKIKLFYKNIFLYQTKSSIKTAMNTMYQTSLFNEKIVQKLSAINMSIILDSFRMLLRLNTAEQTITCKATIISKIKDLFLSISNEEYIDNTIIVAIFKRLDDLSCCSSIDFKINQECLYNTLNCILISSPRFSKVDYNHKLKLYSSYMARPLYHCLSQNAERLLTTIIKMPIANTSVTMYNTIKSLLLKLFNLIFISAKQYTIVCLLINIVLKNLSSSYNELHVLHSIMLLTISQYVLENCPNLIKENYGNSKALLPVTLKNIITIYDYDFKDSIIKYELLASFMNILGKFIIDDITLFNSIDNDVKKELFQLASNLIADVNATMPAIKAASRLFLVYPIDNTLSSVMHEKSYIEKLKNQMLIISINHQDGHKLVLKYLYRTYVKVIGLKNIICYIDSLTSILHNQVSIYPNIRKSDLKIMNEYAYLLVNMFDLLDLHYYRESSKELLASTLESLFFINYVESGDLLLINDLLAYDNYSCMNNCLRLYYKLALGCYCTIENILKLCLFILSKCCTSYNSIVYDKDKQNIIKIIETLLRLFEHTTINAHVLQTNIFCHAKIISNEQLKSLLLQNNDVLISSFKSLANIVLTVNVGSLTNLYSELLAILSNTFNEYYSVINHIFDNLKHNNTEKSCTYQVRIVSTQIYAVLLLNSTDDRLQKLLTLHELKNIYYYFNVNLEQANLDIISQYDYGINCLCSLITTICIINNSHNDIEFANNQYNTGNYYNLIRAIYLYYYIANNDLVVKNRIILYFTYLVKNVKLVLRKTNELIFKIIVDFEETCPIDHQNNLYDLLVALYNKRLYPTLYSFEQLSELYNKCINDNTYRKIVDEYFKNLVTFTQYSFVSTNESVQSYENYLDAYKSFAYKYHLIPRKFVSDKSIFHSKTNAVLVSDYQSTYDFSSSALTALNIIYNKEYKQTETKFGIDLIKITIEYFVELFSNNINNVENKKTLKYYQCITATFDKSHNNKIALQYSLFLCRSNFFSSLIKCFNENFININTITKNLLIELIVYFIEFVLFLIKQNYASNYKFVSYDKYENSSNINNLKIAQNILKLVENSSFIPVLISFFTDNEIYVFKPIASKLLVILLSIKHVCNSSNTKKISGKKYLTFINILLKASKLKRVNDYIIYKVAASYISIEYFSVDATDQITIYCEVLKHINEYIIVNPNKALDQKLFKIFNDFIAIPSINIPIIHIENAKLLKSNFSNMLKAPNTSQNNVNASFICSTAYSDEQKNNLELIYKSMIKTIFTELNLGPNEFLNLSMEDQLIYIFSNNQICDYSLLDNKEAQRNYSFAYEALHSLSDNTLQQRIKLTNFFYAWLIFVLYTINKRNHTVQVLDDINNIIIKILQIKNILPVHQICAISLNSWTNINAQMLETLANYSDIIIYLIDSLQDLIACVKNHNNRNNVFDSETEAGHENYSLEYIEQCFCIRFNLLNTLLQKTSVGQAKSANYLKIIVTVWNYIQSRIFSKKLTLFILKNINTTCIAANVSIIATNEFASQLINIIINPENFELKNIELVLNSIPILSSLYIYMRKATDKQITKIPLHIISLANVKLLETLNSDYQNDIIHQIFEFCCSLAKLEHEYINMFNRYKIINSLVNILNQIIGNDYLTFQEALTSISNFILLYIKRSGNDVELLIKHQLDKYFICLIEKVTPNAIQSEVNDSKSTAVIFAVIDVCQLLIRKPLLDKLCLNNDLIYMFCIVFQRNKFDDIAIKYLNFFSQIVIDIPMNDRQAYWPCANTLLNLFQCHNQDLFIANENLVSSQWYKSNVIDKPVKPVPDSHVLFSITILQCVIHLIILGGTNIKNLESQNGIEKLIDIIPHQYTLKIYLYIFRILLTIIAANSKILIKINTDKVYTIICKLLLVTYKNDIEETEKFKLALFFRVIKNCLKYIIKVSHDINESMIIKPIIQNIKKYHQSNCSEELLSLYCIIISDYNESRLDNNQADTLVDLVSNKSSITSKYDKNKTTNDMQEELFTLCLNELFYTNYTKVEFKNIISEYNKKSTIYLKVITKIKLALCILNSLTRNGEFLYSLYVKNSGLLKEIIVKIVESYDRKSLNKFITTDEIFLHYLIVFIYNLILVWFKIAITEGKVTANENFMDDVLSSFDIFLSSCYVEVKNIYVFIAKVVKQCLKNISDAGIQQNLKICVTFMFNIQLDNHNIKKISRLVCNSPIIEISIDITNWYNDNYVQKIREYEQYCRNELNCNMKCKLLTKDNEVMPIIAKLDEYNVNCIILTSEKSASQWSTELFNSNIDKISLTDDFEFVIIKFKNEKKNNYTISFKNKNKNKFYYASLSDWLIIGNTIDGISFD